MDLTKLYWDSNGDECNILEMIKREPEWAANRLQAGEKAIENCIENMCIERPKDPTAAANAKNLGIELIKIAEKYNLSAVEIWRERAKKNQGMRKLLNTVREKLLAIGRQKEFIIEAFIAETGCKPSECEQIQRVHKDGSISWYIQKRAKVKRYLREEKKLFQVEIIPWGSLVRHRYGDNVTERIKSIIYLIRSSSVEAVKTYIEDEKGYENGRGCYIYITLGVVVDV